MRYKISWELNRAFLEGNVGRRGGENSIAKETTKNT